MKTFEKVTKPEALDFYVIECDDSGQKQISILGFTYEGDQWKNIDVSGICVPLSEFVEGMKEHEDYVQSLLEWSREYECNATDEECVEYINEFFDGSPADFRLKFEDVTMDTPVGRYVN